MKPVCEQLKLKPRRNRKLLKLYMTEPFLEEITPHALYELRHRLEKLSEIMRKWNRRELDGNKAMYEVWKLFNEIMEQKV